MAALQTGGLYWVVENSAVQDVGAVAQDVDVVVQDDTSVVQFERVAV